ILDFLFLEFALLWFKIQLILLEDTEDFGDYLTMFFECFREDHNIVVHHGLEGRWRVGKSEKHDKGFKQAAIGPESGLVFVSFLDSDVVVSPSYV
ncbi:hypothetical protein SERLA73DRAFT_67371, partial [Serpula lacrymans var. lacrymans S7.3]